MAASCQNVAQTLAAVAARRPVLEPVLRAFEDVLTARAALAAPGAVLLRACGGDRRRTPHHLRL